MIEFLPSGFLKYLFFLFITTSAFNLVNAQANFVAICPQKKIGKNDVLQVEFRVENASNVESIDPPAFKNFSVVSGPNQESSSSNINGKIDEYVSISYILKPHSPGTYTISPATAKADGKEFQSNSLNVEVTNSSTTSTSASNVTGSPFANFNFSLPDEAPSKHLPDNSILKKGESPEDKIKKNLFAKVDVSKTTCYVGEPIVASFKLYTRLHSETTITNEPSLNGFSVTDMELNNGNAQTQEKVNGQDYNVYLLRKAQLYPLQSGTITLDPLKTDNKVTFIKAEYAESQDAVMLQDFGDSFLPKDATVQQNATLESKPVEIVVKPLPEENKPADFKGAVGSFTIQATLEKNNFTTDDAGNLKIIISGAGNIQMINAPKISWPQGIDGYEAKVNDVMDKSSVPLKGTKTFIYPFTVSNAGTYNFPAISFSYFDPKSVTYKTLTTQPLIVTVTKGKGVPKATVLNNTTNEQPDTFDFFKEYVWAIITAIFLLAIIIFFIFKRNNAGKKSIANANAQTEMDTDTIEKMPAFIIPANPLEEAHKKLAEGNSAEFYHSLDESLRKYLCVKFNVFSEELSKKRINEELDKRNIGLGTALRLSSLLENIESNLYAPSSINQLTESYEKASEVISLLDKQVS